MPGLPSYYFTLFKKFQILNHVPTQSPTTHGDNAAPQSGFNLNNPQMAFVPSNTGTPLTVPDNNKAHSPLWVILNARATGTPSYTLVNVVGGAQNGQQWPAMPPGNPPAWQEFQINPASNKLVDVFGNWIQLSQVNDVPAGVIAQMPAAFAGPDAGFVPFVCSMPGDQGVRPGVPPNFWATSLIFLTDDHGITVNPATLSGGSEYFLTAVIGNRGNASGGRYLSHPNSIDVAAAVMVWNTTLSPGVQLPALSNLDVGSTNGIYEQYFLRSGAYDVVGFRMNIQTVFDGIVAALNAILAGDPNALGGKTAEQWVKDQPAHLCAKVVIREHGTSFPNYGVTPDQDRRLAQKNLAPFDMTIVPGVNPNIIWKNFIVGQPIFFRMAGAGANKLSIEAKLPANAIRLYLGIPTAIFEKYLARNKETFKGFRVVPPDEIGGGKLGRRAKPFPDAVILQQAANDAAIALPALGDEEFLGMALGVEYDATHLKPGNVGEITLIHRTVLPTFIEKSRCFELHERIAGGFTLIARVDDPHRGRKGERFEFPDIEA
jgi:hypothetical protein